MITKLMLSVKSTTVDKAKKYVKRKGTSVSRLFEDHIMALSESNQPGKTDLLESLKRIKGIAKGVITKDINYKDTIADILIEKHLK
jgi:hypothetical protein